MEEQNDETHEHAYPIVAEMLAQIPISVAGRAAMLRHVEKVLAKLDEDALFNDWSEDYSKPGATLLGGIATALEKTI